MPGNSFGQIFKVSTCGESHGGALAAIVDGCPSGLPISEAEIQAELDRRKPGQSKLSSPRREQDQIHILSGTFEGKTTGTPILLLAYNQDAKPEDYEPFKDIYRPSHADFTYQMKYGCRDYRGSGRASARETLARVAAGAIAKKYLSESLGIQILSYVDQVGSIQARVEDQQLSLAAIEANIVRCPDPLAAKQMEALIESVQQAKDSIGGVIRTLVRGTPIGLGEPVFDRLQADLAKAMLSINAVKAFEIGSGFAAAAMLGSQHNDALSLEQEKIHFKTNYAGGVLGGISTGADIYFRTAFKPVASIAQEQQTLTRSQQAIKFTMQGRHDPCILPRAVPIVDAMTALVLMDHYLRHKAQNIRLY